MGASHRRGHSSLPRAVSVSRAQQPIWCGHLKLNGLRLGKRKRTTNFVLLPKQSAPELPESSKNSTLFSSPKQKKRALYISVTVFLCPPFCVSSPLFYIWIPLWWKQKPFGPFLSSTSQSGKGALDTPEEISPLFDDTRPMCSTHDIITLFPSFFDIFCFIAKWS